MTHMFKYLKSSVLFILLIVVFLSVQAVCDLALPTYTAHIVDIGIQQQGVEGPTPAVIRASELNSLSLLMQQDKYKELVEPNYSLLPTMEGGRYPLQATEPLYQLNNVDRDTLAQMDLVFSKAILIRTVLSGKVPEGLGLTGIPDLSAILPQNVDLASALSLLPADQREGMLSTFAESIAQFPESMLQQFAIAAVRTEYETIGIDLGKQQSDYILLAGLKMLLVALGGMAAAVLVGFLGSRIAATLGRDLRRKVFSRVLSFSQREMDSFSTASLITRSTNDIQQVQMIMVFLLRMVIYAPILGAGGVIKVMETNRSMAWIIALAVAIILVIVGTLYVFAMPRFKKLQTYVDQLNRVAREILTGLPVIRAFNTQKKEEDRFERANKVLNKTQLFVTRMMSGMMPLMMLVMNGITLLVLWVGAHGISNGAMQVGDMMAFIQYAMQIIMSFLMISMMSVMLPRASVAAKRIDEVITTPSTLVDPANPVAFDPNTRGVVQFQDVSFRYPGASEDTLSHISFTAQPGQTTAILGGTGSGKSTLVHLIPRFYDVTDGHVLIDGRDVSEVSQKDLRKRIGFVPQKGVLFSGTIASNIAYGVSDASDEELNKAAAIAQADGFIEEKADRYESKVSQGGTNVSGGQKQRLSIARAILKRPEVYVFDDSFSALDFKTDAALRSALKQETADSTVIIVAQRISTVLHAEQIIVLDDGKIVGTGTHRELMNSCEVYRQIATSQLSKEELNHANK